jgi:hypothetical protein
MRSHILTLKRPAGGSVTESGRVGRVMATPRLRNRPQSC